MHNFAIGCVRKTDQLHCCVSSGSYFPAQVTSGKLFARLAPGEFCQADKVMKFLFIFTE
jgi:hypothetical protein